MTNSIYEVCSPAYVEALVAAGGDLNREAELLFDLAVESGQWERSQYEDFRSGWVRTRKNTMDAWLEACVRWNEKFYEEIFRRSNNNPAAEIDVVFNTILSLRLGAQECERAGFRSYWTEEKRASVKKNIQVSNNSILRDGCLGYVLIEVIALVVVFINCSLLVQILSGVAFVLTAVLPAVALFWFLGKTES
ncbi:hypothetical protein [Candidatus Spyradosoma sp. SGI.093]|uniref:hypothetical protein n=1 Tax=Candidatus Spyradosoma sp. SGI.093 TaxID=3420583 RepID=UPI003D062D47